MKKVTSNLQEFFDNLYTATREKTKKQLNKARRDFMVKYIIGLMLSRTVHSSEVATHMPTGCKIKSDIRRIERFYKSYELDYELVALLIAFCLPKGKLKLSIDRTEWKFGQKWFNILAVTVNCGSVGIPIWMHLLDKGRGNSNEAERLDLLKKLIPILGLKRISALMGDREFIGKNWIHYLYKHKIRFYIRIRNNQYFEYKDKRYQVCTALGERQMAHFAPVHIYDLDLYLTISQGTKDSEPIAILSNYQSVSALKMYKKRWTIEVLFQSLKKRGFDIEATHLQKDTRLRKLFMICSLAFALCHSVGQYCHYKIKAIKKKNNGYWTNSFFRTGLDFIREAIKLKRSIKKIFKELFKEALIRLHQFYLYSSFVG